MPYTPFKMLDYNKLFADAEAELKSLQAAEANLEQQLDTIKAKREAMTKTYNAIAPLVGKEPIESFSGTLLTIGIEALKAGGISVAARSILDSAPGQDFTAAMVRDSLAQRGWDWSAYQNPLSTVHTTLVRLADSGSAKASTTLDGAKSFYSVLRQIPPPKPIKPIGSRTRFHRYGEIEPVDLDKIPDVHAPDEPHTGFKKR